MLSSSIRSRMQEIPNYQALEDRLTRKQAEADSYRLQADTALKYAEQVWWTWNVRRKRLKIRSVGQCILGYPPEDMEREEQFWWNRIHPEDLKAVQNSLSACLEGVSPVWQCEHRLLDVTGDWVWVEETGFVHRRDAHDRPVEMVGTTRKIEEVFQLLELIEGSDAVISALAHSSPLRFSIRDPEGGLLLASRCLQEEFGYMALGSPEDSLTLEEEDREGWRDGFQKALLGHKLELDLVLAISEKARRRFAIHLVPVKQHKRIFGILELYIPRGD